MSVQREWYNNYFFEPWLRIQRQCKSKEQTLAEADLIEKLLQLKPQNKILDVPYGEGRFSLELASRGHQMTGVDITLPLLDDAQNKATERQLAITWKHRDMRVLPW